jgi:hypothetical protein
MAFHATKQRVLNRGVPPDSFLVELIAWGRTASDEIFAPNQNQDVYSSVVGKLGPWRDLPHRRAAMLEVMRVLAGFESSWDWNEGVDTHNPTSTTPDTIEAGAWQVSANSMSFGPELKALVFNKVGSLDGNEFQEAMKRDHPLAMEYVARLLRRTVNHHGPVKRHEIDQWLRRDAVEEFQALLGAPAMSGVSTFERMMSNIPRMIAEPAAAGVHGFDANTKLTAATAKALREAGFRFAVRYLSRKAKPSSKDLTADELNVILDAGLAVMAVQHVAPDGWTPSDTLGVEYGGHAAAHARTVGLVEKSSVWLDLEGVAAGTAADAVIAYCNAWFREVESAGYTTGVYVGANSILTGDELYLRLKTKHYWKSGSSVPDIPHRGYCMVQHITPNDKVGGVEIDRNVTFVDAFGSAPMLVTRGLAIDMAALASPNLAEPVAPSAPAVVARNNDEAILRELAASYNLSAPMEALINFRNDRGAPMSARYWAIADFNLRSSESRLFLFDVQNSRVQSYLCAHGKGSEGPTDDGYASVFSNENGSNCTSLGVYRCAETYDGKHGFSMRLDGLEATNSHARARAIVVHGANYVSPEMIRHTGRIGRSDGCLAVENRFVTEVVSALTGGSLLVAWSLQGSRPAIARFVADDIEADEVWSELEPPAAFVATGTSETAASLAKRIQQSPKIVLARAHASGVQDNATAFENIKDTAEGGAAHRSSYGNAPGGVVNLDRRMLKGMLALTEVFSFSVSEFCGGSHNPNSRHYAGCTADINTINGQHVAISNPFVAAFQQRCRELGATEVLGPGDKGHSTHIHAGWPRPL